MGQFLFQIDAYYISVQNNQRHNNLNVQFYYVARMGFGAQMFLKYKDR